MFSMYKYVNYKLLVTILQSYQHETSLKVYGTESISMSLEIKFEGRNSDTQPGGYHSGIQLTFYFRLFYLGWYIFAHVGQAVGICGTFIGLLLLVSHEIRCW